MSDVTDQAHEEAKAEALAEMRAMAGEPPEIPEDVANLEAEVQAATEAIQDATAEGRGGAPRLEDLPPDLRLLRKLDGWLRMQPEWVIFLAPDRQTRRKIARDIARAICRIPHS